LLACHISTFKFVSENTEANLTKLYTHVVWVVLGIICFFIQKVQFYFLNRTIQDKKKYSDQSHLLIMTIQSCICFFADMRILLLVHH